MSDCERSIADPTRRRDQGKVVAHAAVKVVAPTVALLARESVLVIVCCHDTGLEVRLQFALRFVKGDEPGRHLPIAVRRVIDARIPSDAFRELPTHWTCRETDVSS